mgnify:CR=1 FL=1
MEKENHCLMHYYQSQQLNLIDIVFIHWNQNLHLYTNMAESRDSF